MIKEPLFETGALFFTHSLSLVLVYTGVPLLLVELIRCFPRFVHLASPGFDLLRLVAVQYHGSQTHSRRVVPYVVFVIGLAPVFDSPHQGPM